MPSPLESRRTWTYTLRLQAEIDEVNHWIYHDINNGVYKRISRRKGEEAVKALFVALDRVEDILSTKRFLCGSSQFVEADRASS